MRSRLLSILVELLIVYAAFLVVFGVKVTVEGVAEHTLAAKAQPQEIRMVFVGDVMLSRAIGKITAEKQDYRFHFLKIASTTREADIAFANLENPVSTGGTKVGSKYSFRADPKMLEGLKYAGFNVVSIANNHIWDYGKQAFYDTLAHLHDAGIVTVGGGFDYDDAHTPKVLAVGKTRVAFLAYTNLISKSLGLSSSTPAVSRFDDDILRGDIEEAKKQADVVVVSFHWGDEYQTKHNAEQERIAKLAIDEGASIVVGHHPHVVQEVEEYNGLPAATSGSAAQAGGLILYSLGNFIFDQNFSSDTERGLLVEVAVMDGKIIKVIKKEVTFTGEYQPSLIDERVPR